MAAKFKSISIGKPITIFYIGGIFAKKKFIKQFSCRVYSYYPCPTLKILLALLEVQNRSRWFY